MRVKYSGAILFAVLIIIVIAGISDTEADLEVERELVIAPKSGRAGANIGSVNFSTNISMVKADVTIKLGALPASVKEKLALNVHAAFIMKNESSETLSLVIGFPVSNSQFSSFSLEKFEVKSDGASRNVYNRITGYPRRFTETVVSGQDQAAQPSTMVNRQGVESRDIFGRERIGNETFQNLMVWKEAFDPGQTRSIEVKYAISIPLQKNSVSMRKEKGSYKGAWPQEANNVPKTSSARYPKEICFISSITT